MNTSSSAPPVAAPALIYPHIPMWAAVVIACVSSFMVVMDGAIVNIALPAIQADLHLSQLQVQWVVDAYLLSLGGCTLLAARAGDLYGRKRVLQSGLAVFTLSSLAGGLAGSAGVLLLARAMQGIGASALATSTLAVIVAAYPAGRAKSRAISAWAASSAMATALGVVIGGVLTAQAGWRWVMFVNVPLGIALIAGVAACIRPGAAGTMRARLNIPGAVSITLGMGALILGISQSVSQGWNSGIVLAILGTGAALISAFLAIQARSAHPLIRLSIFKLHNVRMGNIVVLGLGASLTASSFFLSIVLQQILGYDALDTGLALLPMGMALAIAAIVSRPLMDSGVRHLPFAGGMISAAGLIWLGWLPLHAEYVRDILGPTLLTGLGLGLMLMTAIHTALSGVPPKDAGLASGLFNTARQLGAALGIACLSTLAHTVARDSLNGQSPMLAHLTGYHAAFLALAGLSALAACASLRLRQLD